MSLQTVNAREHVESRLQRIKLEKAVIEKHNERLESDTEHASDRLTAEAAAGTLAAGAGADSEVSAVTKFNCNFIQWFPECSSPCSVASALDSRSL